MSVSKDVFSIINTLPEAVLIISLRRGKVAGANAAFYELMEMTGDSFIGAQFFRLPLATKKIRHGLLRMFVKASRDAGVKPYSFTHVAPNGAIKNISASAVKTVLGDQKYVVFKLKQSEPDEVLLGNSESWNSYLKLSGEPYMEFRPVVPVSAIAHPDRLEFLQMLGSILQVKFFNNAAGEFYGDGKGSLEGKSFLSLFHRESDALGFLDMLSVVGYLKNETTVSTNRAVGIRVEMNCAVDFDDKGHVLALYCGQRDLSESQRYKDIIGGNRLETDFMFNQPFVGFAFLVPPRPLERPSIDNLDAKLDEMLQNITVFRANQAMFDTFGLDKVKFLMKPMRELFSDDGSARQVLKELFVMRSSSSGCRSAPGEELGCVSVYRATFDDADRLTGVFVVASRHNYGYRPRHVSDSPFTAFLPSGQ